DRRGDLMLLINGMPVVHIELKRSGIPVSQASNQIEKYMHEGVFSGLFSLVQIFVAMTPEETIYFANPGPDGKFNKDFFFHWADPNNEPMNDWKEVASRFLYIPMVHQLIGFYTVADTSDGVLKVMRSYQYWAASRISDCVTMRSEDEGIFGGYIWHTTGSGKTMTSFKSAQLIANSREADKVIFLADRIELGTQTLLEYKGFASDYEEVQATENTNELVFKLKNNDVNNTLIVTSIQKMSNVNKEGGFRDKDLETINSKRLVFITDECHRSTFGEMLGDIKRTFPHAMYFGFTGTPIFDENQKKMNTTATIFGDELHRYIITDGIRDGNVLGFDPYMVPTFRDNDLREKVALQKSKSSTKEEALADPEKSKIFYEYMDSNKVPMAGYVCDSGKYIEGIEDLLPKTQYTTKEHQNAVVDDIIDGWTIRSRNGRFHALFATSSIEEAIQYYKLFKTKNFGLKVTTLFDSSIDNNEGAIVKEDAIIQILNDYNSNYGQNFTIPTFDRFKKDVSLRLAHKKQYISIEKDPEKQIDILIVVDQMLTGFDSKWINTLYLDKMLRFEGIIQAFSRTNRVFGPEKPFGTIRYYRKPFTMSRNIEDAMSLYSGNRLTGVFVQKITENMKSMNEAFLSIHDLFTYARIENYEKLPPTNEERAHFAKQFRRLNRHLEAAKIQTFDWSKPRSEFYIETGGFVEMLFDEKTYNILLQRYKELPKDPVTTDSDIPFDIDSHIIEIKAGTIDVDYMNSRFEKYLRILKAEGTTQELIDDTFNELHKSFASLSQEEQKYADVFLHDFENGTVSLIEGKKLRDYITEYQMKAKNDQISKFATSIGLNFEELNELMRVPVNETNINDYGRLDRLMNGIDLNVAKTFLEKREGELIPMHKVKIKVYKHVKDFIIFGGIEYMCKQG
ncbi:MAG: HsdR family type I site-specific deoxyribonuclease, partial [Candidatus Methanomethylophilaceae archaeon]|nr:HsdR family type I site-specific deoxyribonuclease [Candidatus Methanomethylophilaceae archaeon]